MHDDTVAEICAIACKALRGRGIIKLFWFHQNGVRGVSKDGNLDMSSASYKLDDGYEAIFEYLKPLLQI